MGNKLVPPPWVWVSVVSENPRARGEGSPRHLVSPSPNITHGDSGQIGRDRNAVVPGAIDRFGFVPPKREVEGHAPYGTEPDEVMRDLLNEIGFCQRFDGEVNNLRLIRGRGFWGALTRIPERRVELFEKVIDLDGPPDGDPHQTKENLSIPKAPYVGTSVVEVSSSPQPKGQGPRPEPGEQKAPKGPLYPAVFR